MNTLAIIISTLAFLIFFGFIFVFFGLFMQEAGDTYMMQPIVNASSTYANNQNLSSSIKNIITDTQTEYDNIDPPFDLLFILGVLSLFIGNCAAALKAKKEGFFSFFGIVTIGMMFILAILAILEQVREWLWSNFITTLFGDPALSVPFITAFYNNFAIIALMWIAVVIFLNQVDADILNRNSGRFEE